MRMIPLAAGLIAAWCGGIAATPSTHIWAPSSDIQGYKVLHIHHDLYVPMYRLDGQRVASINNLGLGIGVLPWKKVNAEIGFDYRSGLGPADDNPLYWNAKVGVPEGAFGKWSPSIGIGAYDFGTRSNITTYNLLYAKIGWTIPGIKNSFGRVSLGYFTGNKKLLLDESGKRDNHSLMVAWERTMTELSDKLWLCLDFQGTNSVYGAFNYGAAWKFSDNVSVIVGYDIYNNPRQVNTLTWQLDIDIR